MEYPEKHLFYLKVLSIAFLTEFVAIRILFAYYRQLCKPILASAVRANTQKKQIVWTQKR
jgi:hypothetical protein